MQAQRRATESCFHVACLEVPGSAPHQGLAARAAAHIATRASDDHKQGCSAPPGEPQGRGPGWQAHGIPTLLTGRAKPTNPHSHSFPPLHPLATLQQNLSTTSSRVLPLTPTRSSQLTVLPNFTFFDLNGQFGLPSAAAPGSPRPPRCRRSMNSCSELQPGRGQLGQGTGLKACRVLAPVLGCSAPTSFFFSTRFYRSRVAPAGSRHTYYSDCSDPFNQR